MYTDNRNGKNKSFWDEYQIPIFLLEIMTYLAQSSSMGHQSTLTLARHFWDDN